MKERDKRGCDGCGVVQLLEYMAEIDGKRYCARCAVKACARICDKLADLYEKTDPPPFSPGTPTDLAVGARSCAMAIRERGEFRGRIP